jgi:hypothetical protein
MTDKKQHHIEILIDGRRFVSGVFEKIEATWERGVDKSYETSVIRWLEDNPSGQPYPGDLNKLNGNERVLLKVSKGIENFDDQLNT